MNDRQVFSEGPIISKLLIFMLPILGALALQVFYGAVDMAIVGNFSTTEATAGVSIGSQVISYATYMISGMATAVTVFLGRYIGEKRPEKAGEVIGSSIILFAFITVIFSVLFCAFAEPLLRLLNLNEAAMGEGISYTVICGAGCICITAFNLLGAIFRGTGDSRTPLLAVAIACVINIAGDLVLVKGFDMGAAGAAYATMGAQAISVVISLAVTVKRSKKGALPFNFGIRYIRPYFSLMKEIIKAAIPLALNEILLGVSFLVLSAVMNKLGTEAAAAVGVAGKISAFIMIFTSAFSQSLAAFVAQNVGAGKMDRAKKAWIYGTAIACGGGLVMLILMFVFGMFLCGLFSSDAEVIRLSFEFTKAYAIDTVFSAAMFCTCGYLNGCGRPQITLAQCIVGVVVRIPMAFLLMNTGGGSMFITGLCVPISTIAQLIFLLIYMGITDKKMKEKLNRA